MTATHKDSHTILFVDDEEKARKMFTRLVSPQFTVLTAADVKEAKEILVQKHNEIGVLITDQRMPGELGVDLLRYIRKTYPKIIRMLTTAYTDLDDAIEAVNTGEIFRYINKPWNADELLIDLKLALNFFNIEQDRQQLIQEKMSLSHRQSRIEIMKCLMTMSCAQNYFKNPRRAVKAFLEQIATPQILAEETFTRDTGNYWDSEIDKTEKMIRINRCLNEWTKKAQDYDTQESTTQEILDYPKIIDSLSKELGINTQPVIPQNIPSNALNKQGLLALLKTVLQTLIYSNTQQNTQITLNISLESTDNSLKIVTTTSSPQDSLAKHLLIMDEQVSEGDQLLGQLLAMYILMAHIGGSISLNFEETQLTHINVLIPTQLNNEIKDLEDGLWIEDLFVLYS